MNTHMQATNPRRVTVILCGLSEWIEIAKTKAIRNKIWEYVNPPMSKDDVPTLQEPVIPRANDVNQNKATVEKVDADELEELKLLTLRRQTSDGCI